MILLNSNKSQETGITGTPGPLVSIIVITYNQAAYIEAALLSCIAQTYYNIEIVVSDDASKDETVVLVQQLAKTDARIKLFVAKTNRGITGNVQHALDNCHGKYIAFLGGDDIFYPEKIATQVECMEQDDQLALSFTQCHVIHGLDLTPVRTTGITKVSDVSNGYELAGNFGAEIPGPAPMIRASMMPTGGFRTVAPIASDWLFFIETTHKHKCKLLKTPLAAYRIHGKNVGSNRYAYVCDYISSYEFIADTYRDDLELVRRSRNALRRYLLGTFYASIIESRSEISIQVAVYYRSMFGLWSAYSMMRVVQHAKLGMLFSALKPILKKIV